MAPLLVLHIKVKNKPRLQEQGFKSTESMTWGVHLRLDGVKSRHVHLEQPVFPVHSGDPAVMDAPRYVPKPFPIFPKAVLLIIHAEWARHPELKNNIFQTDSQLTAQVTRHLWRLQLVRHWFLVVFREFTVFNGTALTCQLTGRCLIKTCWPWLFAKGSTTASVQHSMATRQHLFQTDTLGILKYIQYTECTYWLCIVSLQ